MRRSQRDRRAKKEENDVPVATSIHCIFGSLSQSNKLEKEIKAIQVRKEKVKLPVFEGVCVCVCVCV